MDMRTDQAATTTIEPGLAPGSISRDLTDKGASARSARSFSFFRNTTFASLLFGYMGYYLCRQNFSVAFPAMQASLGLDKVTYGHIMSIGTLMYAVGKVTTGALADTRGGKTVFIWGALGSAIASLLFGLGTTAVFFLALWCVNRYFQSMGWGGLVNVLSRWFSPRQYGTAMGVMSISYQFGGVLASLFAGYLLAIGLGWKALFVVPALLLLGVALVSRVVVKNSPTDVGHMIPQETDLRQGAVRATSSVHESDAGLSYFARFKLVLSDRMFLLMCVLSFVLTLLRECFNTWMPAYFADMGASHSMAAFKSAMFPLLGCAGTLFAGWISDRYLEGRRGPVMAAMMLVLAGSLVALGQLERVSAWLAIDRSTLAVGLVGFTGFFLLGPYSLVGGVVALDFGGRRTAGTAAGLLDSVGYLGAVLAGSGVAAILQAWGWEKVFTIMAGLSIVGIMLCGFVWRVRPRT